MNLVGADLVEVYNLCIDYPCLLASEASISMPSHTAGTIFPVMPYCSYSRA